MLATSIKVSWNEARTHRPVAPDVAEIVEAILAMPDESPSGYAGAKLAFDKLIDDTTDTDDTLSMIERMTIAVLQLAEPTAGANARLVALRRLLYEAGPVDPRGQISRTVQAVTRRFAVERTRNRCLDQRCEGRL